jgi:hypothetical protein
MATTYLERTSPGLAPAVALLPLRPTPGLPQRETLAESRPLPPAHPTPPMTAQGAGRCHVAQRPIWLCRACGAEWPCLTARSLLPIDYYADPIALYVYLGTMLQAAIEDLYRLNPEAEPDPARMYARFLGWVRPRRRIIRTRLLRQLHGI